MSYVTVPTSATQPHQQLVVPTLAAVLGAAFLVPLGLIVIGAAVPVRMLFPVYTFVVALWIQSHHRSVLPSFVIALFAFSPFLRRLADSQAGFEVFSPLLLGPYFALLPTLPSFIRRALGQQRGLNSPFMILAVCMAYAVFLALPDGRFLSGANELIRWLLPVSLCTFIMERRADTLSIKKSLIVALMCVLPMLTIYGLKQYVDPQLWDILWMNNTRNAAIAGLPFPYQIRVYSMMNSAMSLAVFVTSGFVLLAGEGGAGLIIAATALPVLALTMDRQAWVQCGIGGILLIIQAPPGRKVGLTLGIVVVMLGAMGIMTGGILPPIAQNVLDRRFATFSNLSSDTSADERLRTYDAFYDRFAKSPLGEGFGVNTSTAADSEKRTLLALDSTILEIALTYGVVMGTLFFITIMALTVTALRARRWDPDRLVGGTALLFSILATSPLGSNLTGESGILTWAALGILLAGSSTASVRNFRDPALIRQVARIKKLASPHGQVQAPAERRSDERVWDNLRRAP